MDDHADRLAMLARAWDEVATGYDEYFVPRFAPWVEAAVQAVTSEDLPGGPIVVPCCGTFPELDALVANYPQRDILGIDLSPGMVRIARERSARWPGVRVDEGDATKLEPGTSAAVVSAFGLQQMPEPDVAIRSWAAALRPGGLLSVVFWPEDIERDGPFALLRGVVSERISRPDAAWEDRLAAAVAEGGAAVERDERLEFPMSHADASTFWTAVTYSGPLRALAMAQGEAFMTEVGAEFVRRAPTGTWTHRMRARWIVARR